MELLQQKCCDVIAGILTLQVKPNLHIFVRRHDRYLHQFKALLDNFFKQNFQQLFRQNQCILAK